MRSLSVLDCWLDKRHQFRLWEFFSLFHLWLHRKLHVIQLIAPQWCHWLSCIMGNVGSMFWKGIRLHGINQGDISGLALSIIIHSTVSPTAVQSWTSGLLVKTWHLHYRQCHLATEWHHCRQFIRLHADSYGDGTKFILLLLLFHICKSRKNTFKSTDTKRHHLVKWEWRKRFRKSNCFPVITDLRSINMWRTLFLTRRAAERPTPLYIWWQSDNFLLKRGVQTLWWQSSFYI